MGNIPRVPHNIGEINANPELLNGMRYQKGPLELNVRDAHIKKMELVEIDATNSRFTNVTFENCLFRAVDFRYSTFENVAFINCTMEADGNPDDPANLTSFEFCKMKNILLDNTVVRDGWMARLQGDGGYFYLRNVKKSYSRGGGDSAFVTGENLHIRVIDSEIKGSLRGNGEKDTFMAKDCRLERGKNAGNVAFIKNCHFYQSGFDADQQVVITKSSLARSAIYTSQSCVLADNLYPNPDGAISPQSPFIKNTAYYNTYVGGFPEADIYIYHRDSSPAYLSFQGGKITVLGASLFGPNISQAGFRKDPIAELNLKDVTIRGGIWNVLKLQGGQWENVTIEPPVEVNLTTIKNIRAYNLQFPKGEPWDKQGPFEFNVTRSDKPFSWPEKHVPTPEEMGLSWGDPDSVGYRPKTAN